jgi:thiamine biosynthesis protein ThiS
MSLIQLLVNGENKTLEANSNVFDLLSTMQISADRIAVEINKKVVRKKDWLSISLLESDEIEIIHFVGGG